VRNHKASARFLWERHKIACLSFSKKTSRFSQGAGREAGDGQQPICITASEKSKETSIIFLGEADGAAGHETGLPLVRQPCINAPGAKVYKFTAMQAFAVHPLLPWVLRVPPDRPLGQGNISRLYHTRKGYWQSY